jgi:hypothetical protein
MDPDALKRSIADFHRDKRWILLPDAAAGATALVGQLRTWGAAGIMVVAAVEGVGDLPEADRLFYTRTRGDTVMGGIRAYLDSIEHPSPELLEAVDGFDPSGEALVLGAGFSRRSHLAGRRVYGARPPEWGALEDKTTVDRLWDDAGVRRAPSVVVPVAEAPDAAALLASELGTVWVADNRDGWHGGGEYARWVRDPEQVEPALQWFSAHADTVRVMPFLDGIPCSIHGFGTRDGVAVLLPMEMVILRNVVDPAFVYARAATFWDPPDEVRDEMRSAARRVGELLARRHGYLGGFGIDGVCTADGFLPTELNPRSSVGHMLQGRVADLPLGPMERMLVEGDLDVAARDLEETALAVVERTRAGGLLFPVTDLHVPAKTGVRFQDGHAVAVDAAEPSDATMEIGPASMGSVVILTLDPDRTPIGPSVAPLAVQAVDLARGLWGIDVPPLVPAPDVCREHEDTRHQEQDARAKT